MYDTDWLRRRAIQAAPYEACGFVFDDDSIVEIRNVATNPHVTFKMDLQQANQAIAGKTIAAIWHTHPQGLAYPSRLDLEAIRNGAIRAHWKYLVVTAHHVNAYDVKTLAPQQDSFWETFAQ